MSKACSQRMTTEELLKKATARPWKWDDPVPGDAGRCHSRGLDSKPALACVVYHDAMWKIVEADAELISLAVNSFEAMREMLRDCSEYFHDFTEQDAIETALAAKLRDTLKLANGDA